MLLDGSPGGRNLYYKYTVGLVYPETLHVAEIGSIEVSGHGDKEKPLDGPERTLDEAKHKGSK